MDTPNGIEPAARRRDGVEETSWLSKYQDHTIGTSGAHEEGWRVAVRSRGVLANIESMDGPLIDTEGTG